MNDITKAQTEYMLRSLENQPVSISQETRIEQVRFHAKKMAASILVHVDPTPERTIALRKLEETMMWALKAIALEGGKED